MLSFSYFYLRNLWAAIYKNLHWSVCNPIKLNEKAVCEVHAPVLMFTKMWNPCLKMFVKVDISALFKPLAIIHSAMLKTEYGPDLVH